MNSELFADASTWILQVLIVAAGIYLFLRFLSTVRGSGLMRGLVVTVLFGLIGIAGLSELLGLEEIKKLIEDFTPSIAVILAILFQPELRRIISQLGEQNRLGALLGKGRDETLPEVVQALSAMAGRRVGALIAFECDFALDEYTQKAVQVDGAVTRFALESIFHPGAILHDGAVVIRGDRIVAAACLFPLTENEELSKSTGTRHRAALGLTEETDAVTVVVSEETGQVSIAKRGVMERDIPLERLERTLREKLGRPSAERVAGDGRRPWRVVLDALRWTFREDLTRKLSAVAFAVGLLLIAHREIAVEREFDVQFVPLTEEQVAGFDRADTIGVILPSEELAGDFHLVAPKASEEFRLIATGSRKRIDKLRGYVTGTIDLKHLREEKAIEVDLANVTGNWSGQLSLGVRWKEGQAPVLRLENFGRTQITLTAEHVPLDESRKPANYDVQEERLAFTPPTVVLVGPRAVITEIESGERPVVFEPIELGPRDRNDREERLTLARELTAAGVSLATDVQESVSLLIPIRPVVKEIGTIEKEIAIVDLSPEAGGRMADWQLPPLRQTARFRIETRGLLPADADPSSPTWIELTSRIRRFVQDELRVFVDVSTIREDGSSSAAIQWIWSRDWRKALVGLAVEDDRADLAVRLDGPVEDSEVLLVATKGTKLNGSGSGADGRAPGERE